MSSLTSLSRRGRALVESPPLAEYIGEHFARAEEAFDPQTRPNGYIGLCIAENKRRAADLVTRLRRYDDAPPSVLGYDAMIGNVEFRTNLAAFMSRAFLGRPVEAQHLAVLAGAGTVLEQVLYVIADAGESVLVPTPSYAGFWADLETRDELQIVRVDTGSEEGFRLTPKHLERALQSATSPVRALLLTNPDNPTGRVLPREQLEEILAWAQGHDLHVIFDEVYALTTFGASEFVSGAALRPSLGDRIHVVWAFSKDFGASGLRCGVLVSENADVLGAVDQLSYWSACSGHTQHLLSKLVADDEAVDDYVQTMRGDLRNTYAKVTDALSQAGIDFIPAQAAFFVVCDLRPYLGEPTWEAEARLWRRLLEEANVNLTPGSACRIAEPGFFRLCYAAVDERALLTAIGRVVNSLKGA